jgi:hypothetical protein
MLSHIWFLTLSHVTPGFPKPSPIDVWTRLFSPSSFSNPRDHTKRSERAMSIEQWSSKSNDALASVCSSAIRHGCSLHQQLEDIHGLGLAGHARLRVQQLPQGEPGLPTHAPELLSLSTGCAIDTLLDQQNSSNKRHSLFLQTHNPPPPNEILCSHSSRLFSAVVI